MPVATQNIFNKSLIETPLRLQRLRLHLQPYDIKVRYKPGKELHLADSLSRNYRKNSEGGVDFDEHVEAHVCMLVNNLFSDHKLSLFQNETSDDTDLLTVMNYVQRGWPEFSDIPDNLKYYHAIKDELFTVKGLLLKS